MEQPDHAHAATMRATVAAAVLDIEGLPFALAMEC
jgi:hypothetical protein